MSSSISTCQNRHSLQIHVLLIRHHSHPVESELPEPLAKVCGHLVDLEVRLPVVVPHLELGEDLPVRLSLLVLPQHLARPHHPLVRVLVHGELREDGNLYEIAYVSRIAKFARPVSISDEFR